MLSTALLLGGVLSSAAPANAALTGNICDFAVIIAVRGTNAPAGSGSVHNGRLYDSGGYGGELDQIRVHAAAAAPSYYVAALNYPAGAANYPVSVASGMNTLVQELNWLANQCGQYGPTVFLMGHSQGADVVLNAFANPSLSAKARQSIRGIAVFGDPAYKANQPINVAGSQNGSSGLFSRNQTAINTLNGFKYWGYPPNSNTVGYQQQIRSYCFEGDAFCDSTNPGGQAAINIHNSYEANNKVFEAFKWFEYLTTDFN